MFILTYSCFKYDIHTKFKVGTIHPHSNIIYQTSFILYEFVLRAPNDGEDSDRTCSFGIHTLGEDTVYSPEKTSKHINEMTGQGNLLYEKNKEGTKMKNENGQFWSEQVSVGGNVPERRNQPVDRGKPFHSDGNFMLRPGRRRATAHSKN